MRWGPIALVLAGALAAAAASRGQCERATRSVTELGRWEDASIQLDTLNSSFPLDSSDYGLPAAYVRFLIRAGADNSGAWLLTLRDFEHRPLAVVGASDLAGEPARWTGRVPGSRFRLDFEAGAPADKVVIEFVLMPRDAGGKIQHSIQGDAAAYDDLYAETDREILRLGDNVAFLVNGVDAGNRGRKSWCCSAIFLAGDLVLSNWHCGAPFPDYREDAVWNTEICRSTLVDLAFHSAPKGAGREARVPREYNCTRCEAASRELDYALLRVRPTIGRGAGQGAIRRPRFGARPAAGDPLLLVHHAECNVKQLTHYGDRADPRCAVIDGRQPGWKAGGDTEFTHRCDTELGSSGAPMFNAAGELVGLHHLGFEVVDPSTCKTDRLNKAVHIDEILKDIACRNPDTANELGLPRCERPAGADPVVKRCSVRSLRGAANGR